MSQRPGTETKGSMFYLPDFCEPRMVLAVVLIAELVAFMLTLARHGLIQPFWTELARISLFLLWIGLASAAVLCYARPHLARLSTATASIIAFCLLLATTTLVSEGTYWLGRYWLNRVDQADSLMFPGDHALFLARNLGICMIVSALALRYFYVSFEWRRNVEMEARSRINALQARIRPHFLFNSMNTIASLTRSNPHLAEEAVEDLADLFRASLNDGQTHIRMKEELEVARLYQRIEQLRLGERLKVDWRITGLPMRALVPGLTVQPLLENAIYHGIEPIATGGTVTIEGEEVNGAIRISVRNPVPSGPGQHQREGNRLALANIEQRLELAYPGKASVEVESRPGEYRVTLRFPFVESTP